MSSLPTGGTDMMHRIPALWTGRALTAKTRMADVQKGRFWQRQWFLPIVRRGDIICLTDKAGNHPESIQARQQIFRVSIDKSMNRRRSNLISILHITDHRKLLT